MFQNLVSQVKERAAKILPQQAARFIPEWQALSHKISELGGKTAGEIERLATKSVDGLIGAEEITQEIRQEIVAMIVEVNTNKKLVVHFPYLQELVATSVPKSVKEVKEWRHNLVTQLKEDAAARLALRKKEPRKKASLPKPTPTAST